MNGEVEKESSTRLVLGCGTGRCGTGSLAALLNYQEDSAVSHECRPHLSWNAPWKDRCERLTTIAGRSARIVGDVSFWHIVSLSRVFEAFPEAKVICLQRDKQETVDSWLALVSYEGSNYWQDHNGLQWKHVKHDRLFPDFNHATGVRDACGMWWDWYYARAECVEKVFPSMFRVFPLKLLNDSDGVRRILSFAGIPLSEQAIQTGRRDGA